MNNKTIILNKLSVDNFYVSVIKSDDYINNIALSQDKYYSNNKDIYLVLSAIQLNNEFYVLILKDINTHENEDNKAKEPNYEEGYCSCSACGYFDVTESMNRCPKCGQRLIW